VSELIGVDREVGTIEKGKLADIPALQNVAVVMKGGVLYKRSK